MSSAEAFWLGWIRSKLELQTFPSFVDVLSILFLLNSEWEEAHDTVKSCWAPWRCVQKAEILLAKQLARFHKKFIGFSPSSSLSFARQGTATTSDKIIKFRFLWGLGRRTLPENLSWASRNAPLSRTRRIVDNKSPLGCCSQALLIANIKNLICSRLESRRFLKRPGSSHRFGRKS